MSSLYDGLTEDSVNSAEVARKSVRKCVAALATLGERYPSIREECAVLKRTAEKITTELDRQLPSREEE
jgi:hypothetical protein